MDFGKIHFDLCLRKAERNDTVFSSLARGDNHGGANVSFAPPYCFQLRNELFLFAEKKQRSCQGAYQRRDSNPPAALPNFRLGPSGGGRVVVC